MKSIYTIVTLIGWLLPGYSSAITLQTQCITNNSGVCSTISSLITLDITDSGNDTYFQFNVAEGDNVAVKSIYFDDEGGVLGDLSDSSSSSYAYDFSGGTLACGGVKFDPIATSTGNENKDSLPSGNNIGFGADYYADAENPTGDNKNGIDNGEWLGITFKTDFSLILAAINSSELVIGLHVGSIGDESESLTVVPVPAAFWLFGTALIGFIGFSRRTKV